MSVLSIPEEVTLDHGVQEPSAFTMGGSAGVLRLHPLHGETFADSAGTFSIDDDELTDQEVAEMREAILLFRSGEAELTLHEDLVKELMGD